MIARDIVKDSQETPRRESGNIANMHLDIAKWEQRTQQETKPLTVAVLALPEVLPLDFGIPLQVLGRNTGGLY